MFSLVDVTIHLFEIAPVSVPEGYTAYVITKSEVTFYLNTSIGVYVISIHSNLNLWVPMTIQIVIDCHRI